MGINHLETNILAPENGWLEDEFPFGMDNFQVLCWFRVNHMLGVPLLLVTVPVRIFTCATVTQSGSRVEAK